MEDETASQGLDLSAPESKTGTCATKMEPQPTLQHLREMALDSICHSRLENMTAASRFHSGILSPHPLLKVPLYTSSLIANQYHYSEHGEPFYFHHNTSSSHLNSECAVCPKSLPDPSSVVRMMMNKPLSSQERRYTSESLQPFPANIHRIADKVVLAAKTKRKREEQEKRAMEQAVEQAMERTLERRVTEELANNREQYQKDQWITQFFSFILNRFPDIPDPRPIFKQMTLVDIFGKETRPAENVQRDMIMFFTDMFQHAEDMKSVRKIIAELRDDPLELAREVCRLERHNSSLLHPITRNQPVSTNCRLRSNPSVPSAGYNPPDNSMSPPPAPPSAEDGQGLKLRKTDAEIEADFDRDMQRAIEESLKDEETQEADMEAAMAAGPIT